MENRSEKRQCHLWLIQLVIVLSIGGGSLLWTSCATARSQAVGNDEKTVRRDSMIIAYTYRQWMQRNWFTAVDYSLNSMVSLRDIQVVVPLLYYNTEDDKLIAVVILTMHNARTRTQYSPNDSANKICPYGSDTVAMGRFIAGFKKNNTWQLYPMNVQYYDCYGSSDTIVDLGKAFIERGIRQKEMNYVAQDGPERGEMKSRTNDYGVLDPGFWTGGWLWMQDTVGSDSLYWFQNGGYVDDALEKCFKCIIPLVPPVVVLPDSLRIDEK